MRWPSTRSASVNGPVPAGFVTTAAMPAGSMTEMNSRRSVISRVGTGCLKFTVIACGPVGFQSCTIDIVL